MLEEKFINKHSDSWKELENIVNIINKKGIKKLETKKIKSFLELFRKSSHHLAYARTHYPESNTVSYLNNLLGKCHSHVYAVKKISSGRFKDYILIDFPDLLKKYRSYIIASFAFFFLGVLISLFMVLSNPDNAQIFLPQQYIDAIKNNPSGGGGEWNYPLVSSYIMVNNILVSLRAFIFGITLGLGTIYVLFFNGTILGSLTAIVYLYGSPVNYWSLILPHGIIELTAIFISGAAGLIIAKNILIPGKYSRKDSIIRGSKKAISLVMGVVVMLIIAGIIEGFFTPLEIGEEIKLIFAGLTAIILTVYFALPYFRKNKNA
ncbi:MAG: stage II sporulation protein M [Halanaerobiaceae bacterium]